MAQTDKEKYAKRIEGNKRYDAYIPKYLANAFDEKLKKENLKFTKWLTQSIIKYLEKK